eukprot:2987453-Pleurochrysis_carterae.AAC.1
MHGALVDCLFMKRSVNLCDVFQGRARPTRTCATDAIKVEPGAAAMPAARQCSAPIATPARVLIATSARRNAPKRSRHLQNGQRSIGFVVD